MAILYKITNTLNGKVYIGYTSDTLEKRWSQHRHNASNLTRKSSHFHLAIRKYGSDVWKLEVLVDEPDSLWALKITEPFLIAHYDSTNRHKGYNSKSGGEGGSHHEETRQKLRTANLGKKHTDEARRKVSVANKGKQVSDETRQRMGNARKGKKHTSESRQRMSELKRTDKFIHRLRESHNQNREKHRPSADHYALKELVDQGLTSLTKQMLMNAASEGLLVIVKSGPYRYTTLQDLRDYEAKRRKSPS